MTDTTGIVAELRATAIAKHLDAAEWIGQLRFLSERAADEIERDRVLMTQADEKMKEYRDEITELRKRVSELEAVSEELFTKATGWQETALRNRDRADRLASALREQEGGE